MVNEQLLEYIKSGIQKGIPIETIKNKLIYNGYNISEINEAISAAKNNNLDNKPLVDYVRANIQKGMSIGEIKGKLVSHGWNENEINNAINLVSKEKIQFKEVSKPIYFQKQESVRKYNVKIMLLIILLVLLISAVILLIIFKGRTNNESTSNQRVGTTIKQDSNSVASAIPISTIKSDIRDCGANLNCFIDASKSCTKTKVNYNYRIELSGVEKTTVSYYELKGIESDKCILYLRTESIDIKYNDELIQGMIDSGISNEDARRRESVENIEANTLEGKYGECKIVINDLTSLLQSWKADVSKAGIFSSEEINNYECSGGYFN